MTPDKRADFIRANTSVLSPPHVPELRLHLADDAHTLWHKTEEELAAIGLPPPFWAFAWAGGQGLARFILDNPDIVAGKRVIDFATGSGIVAIAAMMAGARSAHGVDIDPFCETAVTLNTRINNVTVTAETRNIAGDAIDCDVLLAGDVFYDKPLAETVTHWFAGCAARSIAVYAGDPGRHYMPRERLELRATYQVPVTRVLEDAEVKKTSVWRFLA
jgi:predicted nicotinamide N-methyase